LIDERKKRERYVRGGGAYNSLRTHTYTKEHEQKEEKERSATVAMM
jgi:hypothetical protein